MSLLVVVLGLLVGLLLLLVLVLGLRLLRHVSAVEPDSLPTSSAPLPPQARSAPGEEPPPASAPAPRTLRDWLAAALEQPHHGMLIEFLIGQFHGHFVEIELRSPCEFRVRLRHRQPAGWTAWLVANHDHPLLPLHPSDDRPARPEEQLPPPPAPFIWRVAAGPRTAHVTPPLTAAVLQALARPWRSGWRAAITPEAVEVDVLLRDLALGADPAEAFGQEAETWLRELLAVSRALTEQGPPES